MTMWGSVKERAAWPVQSERLSALLQLLMDNCELKPIGNKEYVRSQERHQAALVFPTTENLM